MKTLADALAEGGLQLAMLKAQLSYLLNAQMRPLRCEGSVQALIERSGELSTQLNYIGTLVRDEVQRG